MDMYLKSHSIIGGKAYMCVLYEKQTENKAYKNEDSPINSIRKYHRGHF